MTRFCSVLAAAASLATASAGSTIAPNAATSPQRAQLDRAQARWNAQHLRDYRFRLQIRCDCPDARRPMTIIVRNGRAHRTTGFTRELDTVSKLFSQIRRALGDPHAGKVTARYDRRRGYPTDVSIDRIKNAIDDEIGWTLDRFRVL